MKLFKLIINLLISLFGNVNAQRPCSSQPCLNQGTCNYINKYSYNCDCPPNYDGINCETYSGPCSNNPCSNNGTCIEQNNSFKCNCPSYYTGRFCEYCSFSICSSSSGCKSDETCTIIQNANGNCISFSCTGPAFNNSKLIVGLIVGLGLFLFLLIFLAVGLFVRSYLKAKELINRNTISPDRQQVVYSVSNTTDNNTSDLLDYENAIKFSKRINSHRIRDDKLPTYEEFLTKVSI